MPKFNLRRRDFLGTAGSAVLATAVIIPGKARAATRLKLAHGVGPDHPIYQSAEDFAASVAERTNGELMIDVFPQNELGTTHDVARQTQMGAVDINLTNPPVIETQAPETNVIQIPYQFDDYAHAHRVLGDTANAWLRELLARNQFHWVANYVFGFRALTNSVREIHTPDDIAGLNLRVPPEVSIKSALEALGATTQTIAFNELYLALASNVVDGQDNPLAVSYANKFYEVQKFAATTNHIYTASMMLMNPNSWSKLSPEFQQVISEEGLRTGEECQANLLTSEAETISKLEAAGLIVTKPDTAPFRELMGPSYDILRERIGNETWEKWMTFVEDGRTA
ncbi:hypothetical protein CBW24_06495 [Pacificitalea manganoxidans]|uniref:Tripartite ATP-independent transporter DctP family solute receptor n=2 Tax=Alphaproteobacteria TaxID=28211 RepID=A0A291LYB5_9RHOB|nr:TRAP transporter substrate-binding protein [Pacificitalea manganoxidans]MAQ44323.1 hypothetical protein [Actibacterium sp.]OWU71140.1 hypothetical protein ATO2_02195 [Roseovarius sp. 22II1-1F6A]HBQ48706.1 hypothetical protein [Hyphomonas atlantica]ATI41682.1 hypothetical protein CBW24_06495 [Pacificitalea manganoxidans]MDR6309129.1 tripartite ATP-independent transporter DctP family solute receptor [Pacificitalea manganoxidans]|tara:strand:- start:475 stop:1491 length:1017 start_codon:yes stop_codon:yes gene_type:complete